MVEWLKDTNITQVLLIFFLFFLIINPNPKPCIPGGRMAERHRHFPSIIKFFFKFLLLTQILNRVYQVVEWLKDIDISQVLLIFF